MHVQGLRPGVGGGGGGRSGGRAGKDFSTLTGGGEKKLSLNLLVLARTLQCPTRRQQPEDTVRRVGGATICRLCG